MANPVQAYTGFRMWGPVLRARLYADPTAPTINISPGDVILNDLAGIVSAKLGLGLAIYDAAVVPATPGDAQKILGVVLACFDEKMDPLQYIPPARVGDGTVAGYCLVADHPAQQMMAAGDSDTGFADADLNLNYEIGSATLSAPDTRTKISTQYITVSGAAVTVTIPLRLYGQAYPGEDTHDLIYCRMICGFNPECHHFGAGLML